MKIIKEKLRLCYRNVRPYIPATWQWWILSCFAGKCSKGNGVYIHPSVQMLGAAHIRIGSNTCLSERCWLNVNKRKKDQFNIKIGENCFIGRNNFFSSGNQIVLADYVLTTIDCKFICANHIVDNPFVPYIASGVTDADSIYVGVNCFIGAGAVVLGNVSIGHGSVIGANTLVTKDVPPFSQVIGSPGKVVRRYSFEKKAWVNAGEVSEADLESIPKETTYLMLIKNTHPKIFMPLVATGTSFGNI